MLHNSKYRFSFTASSLRLNEMISIANHKVKDIEFDYVNELGKGKSSTGKRMFMELNSRINKLTDEQLSLFTSGNLDTQKQIAFLSICKTYDFIRDFCIEVLREKLLVFDYDISDGDYISFYRRKTELHSEMESLTELTQSKIKQVTFKILEQAGIIDNIQNKNIQPQLLDSEVIEVIEKESSEWLKIFFFSDIDIKNNRT